MRAAKVTLIFLGLMPLSLIACGNQSDYEIYSNCLLKTMNGQDKSMKHHAMESCESKHPYEKKFTGKIGLILIFRLILFRERFYSKFEKITQIIV